MLKASIIICTRDRAESLRETLSSLAKVVVPPDLSVELLVIDNGSQDQTRRFAEQAKLPAMQIRYAFEPAGGQARARNTGLGLASGEIILFTDDDIRFPQNWLAGMVEAIVAGKADAVVGGIKLAAHLERPWMERMHRSWLACSDDASSTGAPARLIGANMAFSRRVLGIVPGFDTELGPGARGFADDDFFGDRLLDAGFKIASLPEVVVEHHCDPSRLLRSSFISAAKKQGASRAYVGRHWTGELPKWPRLRALRLLLELCVWRALHPLSCFSREGIAPEELFRICQIQYLLSSRSERKSAPRYQRRMAGHA